MDEIYDFLGYKANSYDERLRIYMILNGVNKPDLLTKSSYNLSRFAPLDTNNKEFKEDISKNYSTKQGGLGREAEQLGGEVLVFLF